MAIKNLKLITANYMPEAEVQAALLLMESDNAYNTGSSYSTNSAYPDNQIPFTKKHLAYLKNHPKLDPEQYIANLRLMAKVRS